MLSDYRVLPSCAGDASDMGVCVVDIDEDCRVFRQLRSECLIQYMYIVQTWAGYFASKDQRLERIMLPSSLDVLNTISSSMSSCDLPIIIHASLPNPTPHNQATNTGLHFPAPACHDVVHAAPSVPTPIDPTTTHS